MNKWRWWLIPILIGVAILALSLITAIVKAGDDASPVDVSYEQFCIALQQGAAETGSEEVATELVMEEFENDDFMSFVARNWAEQCFDD